VCGDLPDEKAVQRKGSKFSPCVWRFTQLKAIASFKKSVPSMCVEIDRSRMASSDWHVSSLHVCGD